MPQLWRALMLAAYPALIRAVTFDCKGMMDDGHNLVLEALAGPKTIHHQEDTGVSVHNTTFTIDMCKPLQQDSSLPKEEQCASGARICGVKRLWHNNTAELEEVLNIAGQFTMDGSNLDPEVRWLQNGASHEDAQREGFRVTFNGGRVPFTGSSQVKQQAIIEFICNKDLTGNEGFEDAKSLRKREDEEVRPSLPQLDEGKSLSYVSYDYQKDIKVLRLKWETKYACADAKGGEDKPAKSGSHWGFFTWFIIIVFLLAATYIIFGSWLNYNRYGARGWDLIPHGDTIRDLPYIVKDISGNLLGRIRGEGGSRGGYAAV